VPSVDRTQRRAQPSFGFQPIRNEAQVTSCKVGFRMSSRGNCEGKMARCSWSDLMDMRSLRNDMNLGRN